MAGLEDGLHAGQHLLAQAGELGPAVVDGGQADGPQDAVRHRAGARDLEEVAASEVVVELQHGVASFAYKTLKSRPLLAGVAILGFQFAYKPWPTSSPS